MLQKNNPLNPPADQLIKWLYLFIGFAALLNFTGIFVPVMGPDGALYVADDVKGAVFKITYSASKR